MSTTLKLRHLVEAIADMCDAGDYDELCAYAMCSAIDAHRMSMQCDRLLAEGRAAEKRAEKAEAERDTALAEAKAAREIAQDAVEAWRLRESVAALRADRARAEAERGRAVQERDEARSIAAMRDRALTAAVQEREAFSLRLSAAERERDEARAALDLARESAREAREEIAQSLALVDDARAELDAALARPTYEARTTMPTPEECDVHQKAGGRWLRAWHRLTTGTYCICVVGAMDATTSATDGRWLPLDASGLPCAWPVPSAEVTP